MPCPSPAPRDPPGAKRGAIYLMMSDWPSRKVKAEPQIVYGYQAKENGAGRPGRRQRQVHFLHPQQRQGRQRLAAAAE